jgi:hypothetical protein
LLDIGPVTGATAAQAYRLMAEFFIPNSIKMYEEFFQPENEGWPCTVNRPGHICRYRPCLQRCARNNGSTIVRIWARRRGL